MLSCTKELNVAISEKFEQAVIGTQAGDIEQTLIQIHRPEINLASAYRVQDPAIEHYLRGLDIEHRYMIPTAENPHPQYGIEPASFEYDARSDRLAIIGDVPEGDGRTPFFDHAASGARLFSRATGFDRVAVVWRVLGQEKRDLLCHIDNQVSLRGLETILGEAQTLWLPDRHVDRRNHQCTYDDRGGMISNRLRTTFEDHARMEQIGKHHMSIHKGGAFANPLFHTAAGLCPELNMRPGTRSILIYDQAYIA